LRSHRILRSEDALRWVPNTFGWPARADNGLRGQIMPTTLPFPRRALTQIKVDSRDDNADRFINSNLLLVLGFCALGLVTTLALILHFPDLGALIESCNQF
jgi:hypothetical protein